MVSHPHKCIFIHIPKTAGMSVENSFLKSLNLRFYQGQAPPLLLSYNQNLNIGPQSLAHLSPVEYLKHSYVTREMFDDYFKFVIVRNPWERMISLYKHFMFNRLMSFEDFLKIEFPKLQQERYYFIKPQVDYIYDEHGNQVVDFIGHFETLNKDFELVKKQLAYVVPDLEHVNVSTKNFNIYSRWNLKFVFGALQKKPYLIKTLKLNTDISGPYQNLYTENAKRIVNDFYKKDIEKLGYTF